MKKFNLLLVLLLTTSCFGFYHDSKRSKRTSEDFDTIMGKDSRIISSSNRDKSNDSKDKKPVIEIMEPPNEEIKTPMTYSASVSSKNPILTTTTSTETTTTTTTEDNETQRTIKIPEKQLEIFEEKEADQHVIKKTGNEKDYKDHLVDHPEVQTESPELMKRRSEEIIKVMRASVPKTSSPIMWMIVLSYIFYFLTF